MSAQSSGNQVWVWRPAGSKDTPFRHPSDVPVDDETLSKAHFIDQQRGPRLARISPATLLQMKGNLALIAENGATREVPKPEVLPWYEGLLLLEELETAQGKQPKWCDDDLRAVLEQERSKFKNGQLSSALYTEKRLVGTAVTGTRFVDAEDREWQYRRENLRGDERASIAEGEDGGGFFRIRDVIGYLPPWEAFCHEKCGFYQDFYQVRWEHPFSEVDYSRVENGCVGALGTTWEPDECLPAHLDFLRLAAKRAWIKKRREHEQKVADERQRQNGSARRRQDEASTPGGARAGAEGSPPAVPRPAEARPAKRARVRRDGAPLERDLFRSARGHDFAPGDVEQTFGGIRSGWPKRPEDYPPGYGVANPPGFCMEGCDCMDDQRPQRSWETTKAWLEDPVRSAAANSAIEALSAQTRFVRRRGQVSKMCFFETQQNVLANQTHARAALDLAGLVERAVTSVLMQVPLPSLAEGEPPVRIPARTVLFEDLDYEPLRCDAVPAGASQLPQWLRLDADDGRLWATDAAQAAPKAAQVRVELTHAEGVVGAISCSILSERPPGSPIWSGAVVPAVQRFGDTTLCPLEKGAREGLYEHFKEVYDFRQGAPRDRTLGEWLEAMGRILRLLRTTTVANVTPSPAHRALSKASMLPRTP